ncbi:hypothetical protein GCM10022200_30000 [Microbacterium awajiense]|uniref:Helicase n=1 Tax=Microbacterium awajiense TaxID=415214 RepID=A0ABP7B0I6_9MICO
MAGSVLTVGVTAASVAVTIAALGVGAAAVQGQRLAAAADAAALAAADAASGAAAGDPCERADDLAAAWGVALAACDGVGLEVTVVVETLAFGVVARAAAKAGPPSTP